VKAKVESTVFGVLGSSDAREARVLTPAQPDPLAPPVPTMLNGVAGDA
jgi:hypothetical protein